MRSDVKRNAAKRSDEAKRRSEATKRSRATAYEKEEISGEKKGKRLVKRIETKYKIFQKRPSEHTKGGAGVDGGLCPWSPPRIGNSGKNCSYLSAK